MPRRWSLAIHNIITLYCRSLEFRKTMLAGCSRGRLTARAINISSAGYIRLHMYIIYNMCVVPYIIMYMYIYIRRHATLRVRHVVGIISSRFFVVYSFFFLSTPDHRTAVKINLNHPLSSSPKLATLSRHGPHNYNIYATRVVVYCSGCRLSLQVLVSEKFHPKT